MMINYHYFVASCSRHDKILYLILYVDRYNVRVESEMGLQVEGFISLYRVTIPLVQNLQLTSKQKFRFGLALPDLVRPKRNF